MALKVKAKEQLTECQPAFKILAVNCVIVEKVFYFCTIQMFVFMKRLNTAHMRFMATLLLIMGTVTAHAQYYFLNVFQKDGTKVEYLISALDSLNITEKIPVITLNNTILSLTTGGQSQLRATVRLGNSALDVPVSWSSNNSRVATVDAKGLVTAVSAGTATITATSEGQSATCQVTVTKPVAGIKVNYYGCQVYYDHVDINIWADNQLVSGGTGYGTSILKKNWQSAVCTIGDNNYSLAATDGETSSSGGSHGKYFWTWAFKNTTVKNALSNASEANPVKIIMTDVNGYKYVFIFKERQTSSDSYYPYVEENVNTENGYEYVDLGLSVKWATFNVGAEKLEDYGDYYAWGETETYYEAGYAQEDPQVHWKDSYTAGYNWSTYKYCKGSFSTMTKYCSNSNSGYNGFTDTKTTLDMSDDIAHQRWGGNWRMPTWAELDELTNTDNCTLTWTTQNGVNGYLVTSKKTGYEDASIFLPAAGYRIGTRLEYVGSSGYYWSSSLRTDGPYYGREFYFDSGDHLPLANYRYCGLSVRPVCP